MAPLLVKVPSPVFGRVRESFADPPRFTTLVMRFNLIVPYEKNQHAKACGCRWDPVLRTWWIDSDRVMEHQLNEALLHYGGAATRPNGTKPRWVKTKKKGHKPHKAPTGDRSRPVTTEMRSDGSIPDCWCQDVAPWSECVHNEQPLDDESAARLGFLLGA